MTQKWWVFTKYASRSSASEVGASGLLVVAPRYEDTDRVVHCRLELLDEAGDRVDLGELLVKNGFGSRKVLDWGRRIP